jgi:hypothetical protein
MLTSGRFGTGLGNGSGRFEPTTSRPRGLSSNRRPVPALINYPSTLASWAGYAWITAVVSLGGA